MLKGLIMQIQFLTRIPLPVKVKFDERIFARSIILSPVVGIIIGLISVLIYLPFMNSEISHIGVILVIVWEIIITGGLHLDGLADTFDGIFSNRGKTVILEIMRDSRLGTNGALGLIITLLLKTALMVSLQNNDFIYCIIMMPAVSRMNILWCAGNSVYARIEGLGKSIIDNSGFREIAAATAITAVPAFLMLKFHAFPGLIFPVIFTLLFTKYAAGKLGGITGDVLGAVIELSEIVFLGSVLFSERMLFIGAFL